MKLNPSVAAELAQLAAEIKLGMTDEEGADAMAALADRWAVFTQTCGGTETERVAMSFEVGLMAGITCFAGSPSRQIADEKFWQQRIQSSRKSLE